MKIFLPLLQFILTYTHNLGHEVIHFPCFAALMFFCYFLTIILFLYLFENSSWNLVEQGLNIYSLIFKTCPYLIHLESIFVFCMMQASNFNFFPIKCLTNAMAQLTFIGVK